MLTAPMIRVESTAARPLKTVCSVAVLVCLMLAVASPLNGQKPKSPSSKPQTDLVSSARPVRVSSTDLKKTGVKKPATTPTRLLLSLNSLITSARSALKTNPAVEEAIKNHPGKVRLVLKNCRFPSILIPRWLTRLRWPQVSRAGSGKCTIFCSQTTTKLNCLTFFTTPSSCILMFHGSRKHWKAAAFVTSSRTTEPWRAASAFLPHPHFSSTEDRLSANYLPTN